MVRRRAGCINQEAAAVVRAERGRKRGREEGDSARWLAAITIAPSGGPTAAERMLALRARVCG